VRTHPPAPDGDRWIETRRGGLFFVNALLIFPQVMVLVPLLTRMAVRSLGGLPREAAIVDTFPIVAEYLLPRIGWLLLGPVVLVAYNLRLEPDPLPRSGLWTFLVIHLVFLGWTVGVWTGLVDATLPGAP
jgi:hypothetical protein